MDVRNRCMIRNGLCAPLCELLKIDSTAVERLGKEGELFRLKTATRVLNQPIDERLEDVAIGTCFRGNVPLVPARCVLL
jgi:hypothetical protein